MRKFLRKLVSAKVAFCALLALRMSTACNTEGQAALNASPLLPAAAVRNQFARAVPIASNTVLASTTNSATSAQLPLLTFSILPEHNVTFAVDLLNTNTVGNVSNSFLIFDTSLDGSSWKLSSHVASFSTALNSTNTYITTVSNIPAFYMRLNGAATSCTNTIGVGNLTFYPFD